MCFILTIPFLVKTETISMLQWNIWQEGTMVKGGYDAIVNEIVRLQPDFVAFSEVRNYNDTDFLARLIDDLKLRGRTYYSHYSYDSGILSRFPIEQFDTIFPHKQDHGSMYRIYVTSPENNRFAIYSAHLDYQNCAYYEPRGYSGVDWKECELPESVDELLMKNDLSMRDDAIKCFIREANKDVSDGRIVLIGGDFNEPSMLDWIDENADKYDHNGFIVPWTVSKIMLENGYVDTFRKVYPDPVLNPGFTYPSANSSVDISKLTWAPKSDERERLDFIYFKNPESCKMTIDDIMIFGPNESVKRSTIEPDTPNDKFILPLNIWPTDHKGLLVKISIFP